MVLMLGLGGRIAGEALRRVRRGVGHMASTARTTKVKGLHWSPAKQRWVLRSRQDGKRVEVGQFKTLVKAREALAFVQAKDLVAARALYEAEKAANQDVEKDAALERLAARRAEKIARDGHPYTMTYPHREAATGGTVVYNGQMFRCIEQRETISGRAKLPIVVDVWRAFCAVCGDPFMFQLLPKRDEKMEPFWPVRRCETHRQRGRPVNNAKMNPTAREQP